jgi:hypothetical protein
MGVSCDCGHFTECTQDKTGLCWANAEVWSVTQKQWDLIESLPGEPSEEQIQAIKEWLDKEDE